MRNIILIGMKGCGKTTVGKVLATMMNKPFIELDRELEIIHARGTKEKLTFREIFKKKGQPYFRMLEMKTLEKLADRIEENNFVLACGGGTPLLRANQEILKRIGIIIFLKANVDVSFTRIMRNGVPAFFPDKLKPKTSFNILLAKRNPIYKRLADISLTLTNESPREIAKLIIERIGIWT